MSELLILPSIEIALLDYLASVSDVSTLVGGRIYPELPAGVLYPNLTMRKLSSRAGHPRWPENVTVEVAGREHRDVANGLSTAQHICEVAVAYLNTLVNVEIGGCVITGPQATTGPRPVPDQVTPGVTNPRYIAEVSLTYHPA